ncbi:hypothetical protein ADU37_CDS09980 [Thermococcus sp. 2319x1]|nr:hypothetical protein ADU37_CDS09980 [Thermococcus sp. 2319x1]
MNAFQSSSKLLNFPGLPVSRPIFLPVLGLTPLLGVISRIFGKVVISEALLRSHPNLGTAGWLLNLSQKH